MQYKIINIMSVAILTMLLGACANPKEAYKIYQPKTLPVKNITYFHTTLQCFDNLLLKANLKPIYITSEGIPNHAGKEISLLSGRDMLINTVSQLESNVFRFIDLPSLPATQLLEQLGISKSHPVLFEEYLKIYSRWNKGKAPLKMVNYPDYKIIGAITQVDKNIISGGAAASLSFRDADFGVSKDDMVSIISADMNIVNTANFEVLNGAGSSNSIAVYRQGLAGDLGGRIKSSGIFLNFSFDESEGMHQAIRTLLQLNTLEVLGKLAKVPFRKCLQSTYQQTDDEKEDRLEKAQTNSLVSVSVSTDPSFIRSKKSLDLEIISSKASFHLNGALNFKAKVSEDAHVHCFYQNYEGYIWKIFPNKQQASDYLIANKPVGIIEQNKAHEIALSMNNVTEQVMCLAAREELISALPLKEGALSVSSLTQVVSSYKQQNSKPLSQKVFSFQVK